jgi:16S rRNA G966 N2-methylase RsmD
LGGTYRKFDWVFANPPFSQNYSRANMKFESHFREFCPETGKKADLMFVQHRIAEILAAADDHIEKEKVYQNKLQHTKSAPMRDPLTGNVLVTNLLKRKEAAVS